MSDHISILSRLLHTTAIRNGVLSSNIANVDTPGYKAKDVEFEQVLETESSSLVRTSPRHISNGMGGSETGSAIVNERSGQGWADGNTVELDQEVALLTENALLFQAGVSLLSSKIKMFKNAMKT